jgi:hypothetical protein
MGDTSPDGMPTEITVKRSQSTKNSAKNLKINARNLNDIIVSYMHDTHDILIACLGLCLRNIVFKPKNAFWQKLRFVSIFSLLDP